MVFNEEVAKRVAAKLLEIEAVKLQPHKPFTWASGWQSPIYCDNRKTLSYPAIRYKICERFCDIIEDRFDSIEAIAGVATAGIPHGVLVAHALSLPFIYVRNSSKGHGLQNRIEGEYHAGQRVVVVEDLISSGKSSLSAVQALREADLQVEGLMAIFSYGFQQAIDNFAEAECVYYTLSDYSHLVEQAIQANYIKTKDVTLLNNWRKSPETWPH